MEETFQTTNNQQETISSGDTGTDEELRKILESRKAEIKVAGIGGAGGNTISRLMQVGIVGAETLAINTDAQDLLYTDADRKVLIGKDITGGLGAGADPKVGQESAKESKEEIKKSMERMDADKSASCPLKARTWSSSTAGSEAGQEPARHQL